MPYPSNPSYPQDSLLPGPFSALRHQAKLTLLPLPLPAASIQWPGIWIWLLDALGASLLGPGSQTQMQGASKLWRGLWSCNCVTAECFHWVLHSPIPLLLLFLAAVTAMCEQCTLCACFPFGTQACKTFLVCDLQWFWLGLKLLPSKTEQP